MYLKVHANYLPGIQVMATISLQCNGLAEIRQEMSELFDIQVNAQKEKNFRAPAQAHEKVCDKNETNKKKSDGRLKYF